MKAALVLFLGISLILSSSLLAAPGEPDPGFAPRANLIALNDCCGYSVKAIVAQPDGKILIAGRFKESHIARLNADGSLDSTFQTSPGFTAQDPLGDEVTIHDMLLRPDGKILVAGFFTHVNGDTMRKVARLNPDGSPDATFLSEQIPVTVLAIDADSQGRIVIGGNFDSISGHSKKRVARLTSEGGLDFSFDVGPGVDNGEVQDVHVQQNGRILIGGSFDSFARRASAGIARVTETGDLDESFRSPFAPPTHGKAIKQDSRGNILVGGNLTVHGQQAALVRLQPNGVLDRCFQPLRGGNLEEFAIQEDGKILVAGDFLDTFGFSRTSLLRLMPDGSFDPSFIPLEDSPALTGLALDNEGRPLAGTFYTKVDGVTWPGISRFFGGDGDIPNPARLTRGCVNTALPRIEIIGDVGQPFSIETSLDLSTWSDWDTGSLEKASYQVQVSDGSGEPFRFFRLKQIGGGND